MDQPALSKVALLKSDAGYLSPAPAYPYDLVMFSGLQSVRLDELGCILSSASLGSL